MCSHLNTTWWHFGKAGHVSGREYMLHAECPAFNLWHLHITHSQVNVAVKDFCLRPRQPLPLTTENIYLSLIRMTSLPHGGAPSHVEDLVIYIDIWENMFSVMWKPFYVGRFPYFTPIAGWSFVLIIYGCWCQWVEGILPPSSPSHGSRKPSIGSTTPYLSFASHPSWKSKSQGIQYLPPTSQAIPSSLTEARRQAVVAPILPLFLLPCQKDMQQQSH